jgi:hypothetical protein
VSETLELAKSIYSGWQKGDFHSNDWADPEIEFRTVGGPTERSSKSLAEMSELWRGELSTWENFQSIPEEFRELDDERVLVFVTNRGRGKGSGIDVSEIAARSANLFTIRDGKVVGLVAWWDRERALADLGLDS